MQCALNDAYEALRSLGVYGADIPVIEDLPADNFLYKQVIRVDS